MKSKTNKQIIRQYKKELNQSFLFKPNLKRAFFKNLKPRFEELEEEHGTLTLQLLHEAIGTPEEITNGFYDMSNIGEIRKLARKYTIAQLVCLVCLIVTTFAVMITIEALSQAHETYYGETYISVGESGYHTTDKEK